jgi:hypothetical protein
MPGVDEPPGAVPWASASGMPESLGVSQYSYRAFETRTGGLIGKVQLFPVQGLVSCCLAPELGVENRLSGTYSGIGIEAPDIAEILIDFEDRCMASIHLDFFQRPQRRQMELICTAGVVIVEYARWDRCTVSVYEAAKRGWEREELITDRNDMFRAEDREFLQAVAEDRPIACTIAEARKSVEVVMVAHQRG